MFQKGFFFQNNIACHLPAVMVFMSLVLLLLPLPSELEAVIVKLWYQFGCNPLNVWVKLLSCSSSVTLTVCDTDILSLFSQER